MSIYLPDELKARMDAAGDMEWSQIAQRAFAMKLAQRRAEMEGDMQSAIERLKASKKEYERKMLDKGRQAGVNWVRTSADYEDVARILSCSDPSEIQDEEWLGMIMGLDWANNDMSVKTLLWAEYEVQPPFDDFVEGLKEGIWDECIELSKHL